MFKLDTSIVLGSGYHGSEKEKTNAVVVYKQFDEGLGMVIITKKEIQTTLGMSKLEDIVNTFTLEIGEQSTMEIIRDLRTRDIEDLEYIGDKERAFIFQSLTDDEIGVIENMLGMI